MIDYFSYNGITYDRSAKEYQFRLVSSSGEKTEIPLRLGRQIVLSMGQGKRCMSLKLDGGFCLNRIATSEKICTTCRLQEDTCIYGADKLLWSKCPKNPEHACFDRNNFTNYLASYGLTQSGGTLDLKSGISINPASRIRRAGYSFVAILKPKYETHETEKGSLLPLAALHELMIPAIASLNHLPIPTGAERFRWFDAVTKNLTNVNFLDESAFNHFNEQITTLMEYVWTHCDNICTKPPEEQWQDLRSLLQVVPRPGAIPVQSLYEAIRSSPLFLSGSDLLSLTITDVYRSLRAKSPLIRYVIHRTSDIEAIREMKRLSEVNKPENVLTRVRSKPEDLRVQGKILMVRGETLVIQSTDGKLEPHMYRFERLSKGRPVITWTNLAGVVVSADGNVIAQETLSNWS